MKQLDELGIPVKPRPHCIELEGSPGSYEAVLRYNSQVNRFRAGAVMVDIGELNRGTPPVINSISGDNLLNRLLARERNATILAGADSAALRGLTIKETAGIFIVSPDSDEPPDEQIVKGMAVASRVSAYLCRGKTSLRATAVTIDKKLCRGCGDCATMCSYIVMRECNGEIPFAYVDQALCLGCGACIAHCPTGAITQTIQSNEQIISTLEAILGKETNAVEAK